MTDWSDELVRWTPPEGWRKILAVDAHAEGEPLRVVASGFPRGSAETVLAWRRGARERHDGLRRTLMLEPRGHADMYGCIVGPPVSERADVSVLFIHNSGFSTMCGHGVIAVTTVLLETGMLPVPGGRGGELDDAEGHGSEGAAAGSPGERVVGLDTPAGFVRAVAAVEAGSVTRVRFLNVPSFVQALDARVDVPEVGVVRYDLAYGGAFYAYVSAGDLAVSLAPADAPRLVDLGRRIKEAVQAEAPPVHPEAEELGFVYGTIFVDEARDRAHHSRNVCVFADGEVDRSPTGTGVSGRLAIHHARGEIATGEEIVVESILGTTFSGKIVRETEVGGLRAVVPEITGRAWITGVNRLLVDPSDPLAEGFLLR